MRFILATLLTLVFPAAGRAAATRPAVEPRARAFDLRDVRLLDGPFKAAMDRNAAYLLELEPDRFLHYFRTEAGLEPKAPPYGGWESPTTGAGRCLGHYLSALSLQYRASGDERFKKRVDYIVDELAECQRANGGGYLSAQAHGKEFWADLAKGNGEALKKYRVPWYITHKLFAGLRDAHQLTGNDTAREVLIALADWSIETTRKLDEPQFQRMLEQEYGGMREVLADVYAMTGQQKYLDLANRFIQKKFADPLAKEQDKLAGLHANTAIAKVVAAARAYELAGDPRDHTIADYFWHEVVAHHTYAIGGNSNDEHFHAPDKLSDQLSATTAETCNTYNMLKLTGHLFAWDPKVEYADYAERALYNHILASQEPKKGMFAYYVSLKPGHFKTYSTPFDSFWCCVGTGMENHTKYGEWIYAHEGTDEVYVNLYVPSELTWREQGVTVRQETRYPEDGTVHLAISCEKPTTFSMKLRYPAWADAGMTIRVNGQPLDADARPGTYLTVRREWRDGDRVELHIPLSLRTEPMPDDPKKIAIFYGPLVLGGQLGTERLGPPIHYAKGAGDYLKVPDEPVPTLDTAAGQPVGEWVRATGGSPLTFRTHQVGRPNDVILMPFYLQYYERYTIYWERSKN